MNFFYHLQIEDPYLNPPKTWRFCQTRHPNHPHSISSNDFEISSSKYHTQNRFGNVGDFPRSSNQEGVLLLQSYLNILKVRQITLGSVNDESILLFNVPIKAVEDSDVLQKVNDKIKIIKIINLNDKYELASTNLSSHFQVQQITKYRNRHTPSNTGDSGISDGIADTTVSSADHEKSTNTRRCDPNLCLFGGICDPSSQKCKCRGPYIGKFIFLITCIYYKSS